MVAGCDLWCCGIIKKYDLNQIVQEFLKLRSVIGDDGSPNYFISFNFVYLSIWGLGLREIFCFFVENF